MSPQVWFVSRSHASCIDMNDRRRYTTVDYYVSIKPSAATVNTSMAYDSFQDFLARLERENELLHVAEPVDPVLEITEIADRVMKSPNGGKALFFDHPVGHDIPL